MAQMGARHLDDVGYRIDLSRHSPASITAGGTLSTMIHGGMQKVEQGVLPLCPGPLPACVLCMPGAGAHHSGLPTRQHISQGPSCREASQIMSGGVTPLIAGAMDRQLLKRLNLSRTMCDDNLVCQNSYQGNN